MSGVIYGAIVVMWLAFLVPMWLKRHDEAAEPKPVERATIAMRVLSRRSRVVEDSAAIAGGSPSAAEIVPSSPAAAWTPVAGRLKGLIGLLHTRSRAQLQTTRPVRASRTPVSAARRRQRVLATLCALTILFAVVAGFGRLPWLAVLPAAALLAGYVGLLAVHGRRVARAGQAPAWVDESYVAAGEVSARFVDPAEDAGTTFAAAAGRLDGYGADELVAPAVSAAPADGFAGPRLGWDPVPVPSPTYVSAPRAPRAVRSIDLSREGAWTSGRLVADAKAAAAAAVSRSSERQDDSELVRRAVGD